MCIKKEEAAEYEDDDTGLSSGPELGKYVSARRQPTVSTV